LKLIRVKSDWKVQFHVPICCCEGFESLVEPFGRSLQLSACDNAFERKTLLLVLENSSITENC